MLPPGDDDLKSRPPDDAGERTRVDLGEDLLEKTALRIESPPGAPPPAPVEQEVAEEELAINSVEDGLQSARILMNEGFLEEAKKILRRVLLMDSRCAIARTRLEEIHELELKQIFSEGDSRRPRLPSFRRKKDPEDISKVNSEKVMRELDRDLRLGVFPGNDSTGIGVAELSLFKDREGMEKFAADLDRSMGGASARDRMDMAVAFLEMGLFDLAIRQLRIAVRDPDFLLAASVLLSTALIMADRPFEATVALEPLLLDTEHSVESKLECFYLMGRAHEGLRKPGAAIPYYQQVVGIEPLYRDAGERLRLCVAAIPPIRGSGGGPGGAR